MDKLSAILAASLLAGPALADPVTVRLDLGGSFDWAAADSIDAMLGFETRQTLDAKARLIWKGGEGALRFETQVLLSYQAGDNVGFAAALGGTPPPASFFDLSTEVFSDSRQNMTVSIDRLSVSYASQRFVLKLGRQAVTWGAGLVFRPSDIIAPFAPNAIDTAYKPGVDMAYAQVLFDNGNDIEAVFVPRRAVAGGPMVWEESTLALRSTLLLGDLDGTALLAQDHGDTLLNLGLGGPMGGAAWNIELGQWFLADGSTPLNILANISNSGKIGEMNITYFAEYFHNGFGVDTATPLDALPTALADRLATGQLFNVGQDFLALGAMLGVSAGVTISPSLLTSLNDGSVFVAVHASVSVNDNLDVSLNASKGFGPNGTEFGGRETSAGSGVYLRVPTSVGVNITRYF
ncbi:MAG TPA: hypothetical protein EYG79_10380 [Rhodobacteraceae bacterium]|nr:hypothetical protein [Paracoccaceae bacterium]